MAEWAAVSDQVNCLIFEKIIGKMVFFEKWGNIPTVEERG